MHIKLAIKYAIKIKFITHVYFNNAVEYNILVICT